MDTIPYDYEKASEVKKGWMQFAEDYAREKGYILSIEAKKGIQNHIKQGIYKTLNNNELGNEDAMRTAQKSLISLIDTSIEESRERQSRELSKITIRDYDVAYKKRFCRIPPFC